MFPQPTALLLHHPHPCLLLLLLMLLLQLQLLLLLLQLLGVCKVVVQLVPNPPPPMHSVRAQPVMRSSPQAAPSELLCLLPYLAVLPHPHPLLLPMPMLPLMQLLQPPPLLLLLLLVLLLLPGAMWCGCARW